MKVEAFFDGFESGIEVHLSQRVKKEIISLLTRFFLCFIILHGRKKSFL